MKSLLNLKTAATLITLAMASQSFASAQHYVIRSKADHDTGIHFDVTYTAGIHHGVSRAVEGDVFVSVNPVQVTTVNLKVPLASITSGDLNRDCHIRESLGIDYTNSKFPKEHVCSPTNELATSGPDSVKFPNVELTILNVKSTDVLTAGSAVTVPAQVRMSIHGITREFSIPLSLTMATDGTNTLRVVSQFPVQMSDYQVQVKQFLFVKVTDEVKVKVDLVLVPQ